MKTVAFLLALLLVPALAAACPRINGFRDANCDGRLVAVVGGDSVVEGEGDEPNLSGGYVRRVDAMLPAMEFRNLGVSGIRTDNYLPVLQANPEAFVDADIVIFDVGRNDWRLPGRTPLDARRGMKALVNFAKAASGGRAYVTASTALPCTVTPEAQEFVRQMNIQYLRAHSSEFRVDVRFDRLPSTVLSWDELHPDSAGYDTIATYLRNFLVNNRGIRF